MTQVSCLATLSYTSFDLEFWDTFWMACDHLDRPNPDLPFCPDVGGGL